MASLSDFVGSKPTSEIGAAIMKRVESWRNTAQATGLFNLWRQNYRLFMNADPAGAGFNAQSFAVTGENGELMRMAVNHSRNLITHILNMATNERPSLSAKATNSETESILAAELFDGVLEYYLRTKRAERIIRRTLEQCLVFGTGFISVEWDSLAGEPWMPGPPNPDGSPGDMMNTGDLKIRSHSVYDVFFDQSQENQEDLKECTWRSWENLYELAKRYPDLEDKILALPRRRETEKKYGGFGLDGDSDDVAVYTTYWAPSTLLPQGRRVVTLADDLVVEDFANVYGQIPLLWVRPNEGMGTLYGYAPMNDLAPLQMFYNTLYSVIATNQTMFGVQNISVERNSGVSFKQLMGGMNLVERNAGTAAPEPLNLTQTPVEVFNMLQTDERAMETISGVNSVARGNPEHSLKSGVALNIVQSMAVQFQSGFQGSQANLLEDLGNLSLKIFRLFAKAEKIVSIVGKNKVVKSQRWSGASFENVDSVVAEITSPLQRTIAGRTSMADRLLEAGLITNPQEYITVLETGQLEPMYQAGKAEVNRIRDENDELLKGNPVPVLRTDNHQLDIQEHVALLNAPAIRRNSPLVEIILAHISEHEAFLQPPAPAMPMGGAPIAAQELPPPQAAPQAPPAPQMGPPPPEQLPGMLPPSGIAPQALPLS